MVSPKVETTLDLRNGRRSPGGQCPRYRSRGVPYMVAPAGRVQPQCARRNPQGSSEGGQASASSSSREFPSCAMNRSTATRTWRSQTALPFGDPAQAEQRDESPSPANAAPPGIAITPRTCMCSRVGPRSPRTAGATPAITAGGSTALGAPIALAHGGSYERMDDHEAGRGAPRLSEPPGPACVGSSRAAARRWPPRAECGPFLLLRASLDAWVRLRRAHLPQGQRNPVYG